MTAGGAALLGSVLLERGSYAASAQLWVDPEGTEDVRFQRARNARSQLAVLGQHPCRQVSHLPEGCRPRLDVLYPCQRFTGSPAWCQA